jgi:HD-GYP domain-containing protein (c-di-GMP phosphodiesterase class II)
MTNTIEFSRTVPLTIRKFFRTTAKGRFVFDTEARKFFTEVPLESVRALDGLSGLGFSVYQDMGDKIEEILRPVDFSFTSHSAGDLKDESGLKLMILSGDMDSFLSATKRGQKTRIMEALGSDAAVNQPTVEAFLVLGGIGQLLVAGNVNAHLAKQVAVAASNAVDNVMNSSQSAATLSAMFASNPSLYEHSASVAMLSGLILWKCCPRINVTRPMVEEIITAGLYHDLGKAHVPQEILNKPAKLTPEEFEIIKKHSELGAIAIRTAINEGAHIPKTAAIVALEHHERMNGSGYPKQRKGRAEDDPRGIHLYSRIVAVADVYSALIMKRVYKPGFDVKQALTIMNHEDGHFDREIFSAFVMNIVEESPEIRVQRAS